MYELPTTIEIKGQQFTVRNRGDYRTVIDCFKLLEDPECTKEERILACLVGFYEEINDVDDLSKFGDIIEAYQKMVWFFNCGQPEEYSNQSNAKLIDWEKDSMLICSAVNKVANTEIRAEKYIHWWTFMGYYMGIGECALSTIVSIRSKKSKGKKLEKYEQQFVRENPQYFWNNQTLEEREFEAEIRKMWNNGGTING